MMVPAVRREEWVEGSWEDVVRISDGGVIGGNNIQVLHLNEWRRQAMARTGCGLLGSRSDDGRDQALKAVGWLEHRRFWSV